MGDTSQHALLKRAPIFIQNQLNHPPIGPNESVEEFKSLFCELGASPQVVQRTAADYVMLLQITTLTFRAVTLERIREGLIGHQRPAAVLALLVRSHPLGEAGLSTHLESNRLRAKYFASKEGKKQVEAELAGAGYAPDAVEVEAFDLALQSVAAVDRLISAAQRQLMAFLKEIERRDYKRAESLRKSALNVVSRTRSEASDKRGPN